MKSMIKSFKEGLGEELREMCEDLRTDYDYLSAGLYYLRSYTEQAGENKQLVFDDIIEFKVRSSKQKVRIIILLVDESEGIHGNFDYEGKIPTVAIQLEMSEIPDSDDRNDQQYLIRKFQTYLAHELMHAYQYFSKNNFIERENTEASEAIPNSFSYIIYFLSHNEIESNLMGAFSQYKKGKRNDMTFCNQLLRTIDFLISDKETGVDKNHYTPQYLHEKYTKVNDLNDLFCLDYILGVYIPHSRFYKFCVQDKDYKEYVSSLNIKDLKARMNILEEIYNILEEKFGDKSYQYLPQAFHLVSNKESLNKLCTSTEYAEAIKKRITDKDFTDKDNVYDEEEDTVVYGRPDLSY